MYIKKFFVRLLCCVIPVAKWRRGLRKKLLFPYYIINLNEKKFLKYIKGKTIAIVGNGPQQIDKHTGAEIDSADIVVRFNTFELDGFTNDYGTRTDIWFNGCGGNYDDERYLEIARKSTYVIWRSIYEKSKEINSIKNFFKKCHRRFIPVYLMPEDKLLPLYNIFNDYGPTIGCVFLWYLKTYAEPQDIRLYGFSFLDSAPTKDNLPHFYHKREINGGKHNMSMEIAFLKKLFQLKK